MRGTLSQPRPGMFDWRPKIADPRRYVLSVRLSRTRLVPLVAAATLVAGALIAPGQAQAATRGGVLKSAAAYAQQQGYHVGIAVLDTKTGQLRGAGDCKGIFASESLIKVFIATRLLIQGRMHGSTAARAWKMITQSDDAIASAFYGSVGGDGLINWMKARYHEPDLGYPPSRAGWWGNTHLRPCGLVKLYAKLKRDRRVAPWLLKAMHHAREYGSDGTYQYFGIPSATKGFAVKQGWGNDYEIGSSADFNTTGFVDNDRYAVAILARGPSSTYGSQISNLLTGVARRLLPGGAYPDPGPMLRGLSRHAGRTAGGSSVTVYGANFSHVTGVVFGSTRASSVKVVSPSKIVVTTPRHSRQWTDVSVHTTHGNTRPGAGSRFLFEQPPQVSSMSAHQGPLYGGEQLTIRGHAFVPGTTVSFGAVTAKRLHRVSRWKLQVYVPRHAAGPANVIVRSRFGSTSGTAARFSYVAAPTVADISATQGSPTRVKITGTDFRKPTTVTFGGIPGTDLYRQNTTTLYVTAPPHDPGSVDVTVRTPYGHTVAKKGFTYGP